MVVVRGERAVRFVEVALALLAGVQRGFAQTAWKRKGIRGVGGCGGSVVEGAAHVIVSASLCAGRGKRVLVDVVRDVRGATLF